MLETRRAKECQRGIAGAAERAKEGGRVPFESSDTRLGSRDRAFESPHSDQSPLKSSDFRGLFLFDAEILHYTDTIWCRIISSTSWADQRQLAVSMLSVSNIKDRIFVTSWCSKKSTGSRNTIRTPSATGNRYTTK